MRLFYTVCIRILVYAVLSGLIFLIVFDSLDLAFQRSTSRWAFNQNSGVLPKSCANLRAISGLKFLRSLTSSLIVCLDTLKSSASALTDKL